MCTLLDDKKRNTANFKYAIERLEAVPVACDGIGHVIGKHCCTSIFPLLLLL